MLSPGNLLAAGAFALAVGSEAGAAACMFMIRYCVVACKSVSVDSRYPAKTLANSSKLMLVVHVYGPTVIKVLCAIPPADASEVAVVLPTITAVVVSPTLSVAVADIDGRLDKELRLCIVGIDREVALE